MTKGELMKFLEPFTDEIEIKAEGGGGFWPFYTINRDTNIGELVLIPDKK
ncbi:hypothetical protein LCGC14_1196540 [marine sediment metagenome]|uniref:Uncharacterized protein n=1 Tax=marine sediment metagenome TaxID=412755 RepID=A0A0F9M5H4_9ZZZZ